MRQVVRVANPYSPRDVPRLTRAATTPKKKRQWLHVYESARKRGYSEGRAIQQASEVVKRNESLFPELYNPAKRNQSPFTAAFATDIASKISKKVMSAFSRRSPRKKKMAKRKRRNVEMGFYDDTGFHPIRASSDYSSSRGGESAYGRGTRTKKWSRMTSKRRKRNLTKRRPKRNPHLAIIGLGGNPRGKGGSMTGRRRRRALPRRNSKGRFVKATNRRRRRASVVVVNKRRRRTKRSPARHRRRNRTVVVRNRWRTRYVKMAHKKRRRRRKNVAAANPRRRRRHYTRATPRRRRRNPVNPVRHRRRRRHLRRRNPGLRGLIGRVNLMQVAEVAGGVFLGDKITTYVGSKVAGMVGVTDATMTGLVKAGLGIVTAGLVWRFRPALGLGIAVGAANGLLNQYVFTPLWGMATPYLPTGMAGLAEYQNRGWKVDNWLPAATGGVAGLANPLMRKGL